MFEFISKYLKYQKNMERIKKQMDAKLKFCKNEVYSSYDPISQAGLVQFGWKKKLKVDHPVDVFFYEGKMNLVL